MIFGRKTGLREGDWAAFFVGFLGAEAGRDVVFWRESRNKPVNAS